MYPKKNRIMQITDSISHISCNCCGKRKSKVNKLYEISVGSYGSSICIVICKKCLVDLKNKIDEI